MNSPWFQSKFTGFFRDFQQITPRAHDPQVSVFAAVVPSLHPNEKEDLHAGGCAWSDEHAANACVGEGIERLFAYPAPQDFAHDASYQNWPLDEQPVAPEKWVLFHPEQHALAGFPFEPFTKQTRCHWICFRDVSTGDPHWVPEEFGYLFPRADCNHRFCPATSTGLAAGTGTQPVVLRALQELIERDAIIGAWWGIYPIEEHAQESAWTEEEFLRLQRPNLRWRFFRIRSPFSNHVTMVTVEGEDREGFCFSIGSSCRKSLRESWRKSSLEAVQGRFYVRHLLQERGDNPSPSPLQTFADHALYYSVHREYLSRTILNGSKFPPTSDNFPEENLSTLCHRLEKISPVLVRNLTPPYLSNGELNWRVVKVLVPGLQPLHGDDHFPHLGGKLWNGRRLEDWSQTPPHPFP